MNIYQLHEFGGEWEYSYDHLIGSYLRKERAEEEKIKAEAKEKELIKHSKRCMLCPFLEGTFSNINDLLSKHPNYCTESKLEETDYGIGCENYHLHWDESSFEIREVEVEE